jgi:hypothetical protein
MESVQNASHVEIETCHYNVEAPENTTRYQALRIKHSELAQVMRELRQRPYHDAIAIFEHIREGVVAGDILKLVAEGEELLGIATAKREIAIDMSHNRPMPPPGFLPVSFSQQNERTATSACRPKPSFLQSRLCEGALVAASRCSS